MSQKIRQEIVLCGSDDNTLPFGINTSAPGTNPGNRAQLDTSQYTSPTYYLEFAYKIEASNTAYLFALRRSLTTTDDLTINSGLIVDGAWHYYRSSSFTPPNAQQDYTLGIAGDGGGAGHLVYCSLAKIIILQDASAITNTETQIDIGNTNIARTNTAVADQSTGALFWKYNASEWDATATFYAEVIWQTSSMNTMTAQLCRTSDNAVNATVVNALSSTNFTRTRVAFTPVDGETYKIRSFGSTTKSNYSIYGAKIIVDQTDGTRITKLAPQILLVLGNDFNATGVQNTQAKWNASEWDAGSGAITYKHAMDSTNASNSAKIRDVTASADISNSTVTGSNQQVSSALGAFTDGNVLDCWVLNTTGIITASRIMCLYAYADAPAVTLPEFTTEPLTPPRWHHR